GLDFTWGDKQASACCAFWWKCGCYGVNALVPSFPHRDRDFIPAFGHTGSRKRNDPVPAAQFIKDSLESRIRRVKCIGELLVGNDFMETGMGEGHHQLSDIVCKNSCRGDREGDIPLVINADCLTYSSHCCILLKSLDDRYTCLLSRQCGTEC